MKKEVILCVDDEKMVLESIKRELIDIFEHQYLIEVAESGPEALDLFKELLGNGCEIPVIISDYIMPGMKGDEFLKKIHELAPQATKIMLTGQAVVEGIANAINEANLFRYLEKPWKKEELKEAIYEAFASYQRSIALAVERRQLIQTKESLQEELYRKNLELKSFQEKLNSVRENESESMATVEQLTENLLLFQELPDILGKMKVDLDSIIHHSSTMPNEPPQYKEPPVGPGIDRYVLNLRDYLTGVLGDLKKIAGEGVEFSVNCEDTLAVDDTADSSAGACPNYLKYALFNLLTAFIRGFNGSGKIAIGSLKRRQQLIICFEIWGRDNQLDGYTEVFRDHFNPELLDPELAFLLLSSYKIIKEHGGGIMFNKNTPDEYHCEIHLPGSLIIQAGKIPNE